MGFFSNSVSAGKVVPVVAIRETAFGDSSWWIISQGHRRPAARSLYYTDFEQILSVLADGGLICLDVSNEGSAYSEMWNAVLTSALWDLGIPRDRLLYVTQNLAFQPNQPSTCFAGEVQHAHYFIRQGLVLLQREYATPESISQHADRMLRSRRQMTSDKIRHFLCMNFTPRWHRWITALFLFHRGYLSRGFLSFPGAVGLKMSDMTDLQKFVPNIRGREEFLSGTDGFLELCPLTLDLAIGSKSVPEYQFPLELMAQSLFQIVTESEVGDGNQVRITEKILKPIVGLQPFIVVGNRGSLHILRAMGFKTFEPLWDESYDRIDDPAARLDAVFAQVDQLMRIPVEVLRSRIEDMTEVLLHNFVHMLKVAPVLFEAATQARLRTAIARMAMIEQEPLVP